MDFLAGRGWVPISGDYDTIGDPGTLDGYLKTCIKRATAGWVAVVRETAGLAEDRPGRPGRIRLAPRGSS